MEKHSLAIACVPVQHWNLTYDLDVALAEGTIFPELNMPFFAAPKDSNTTLPVDENPKILFTQICFALFDARLYLDTHPEDEAAREYYEKCLQKKEDLQKLMQGDGGELPPFEWEKMPLVWEGGNG